MSQQDEIQSLITRHQRRLQKFKEQEATQGINTPPEILTQIEDIEKNIERLKLELATLVLNERKDIPPDLPKNSKNEKINSSFLALAIIGASVVLVICGVLLGIRLLDVYLPVPTTASTSNIALDKPTVTLTTELLPLPSLTSTGVPISTPSPSQVIAEVPTLIPTLTQLSTLSETSNSPASTPLAIGPSEIITVSGKLADGYTWFAPMAGLYEIQYIGGAYSSWPYITTVCGGKDCWKTQIFFYRGDSSNITRVPSGDMFQPAPYSEDNVVWMIGIDQNFESEQVAIEAGLANNSKLQIKIPNSNLKLTFVAVDGVNAPVKYSYSAYDEGRNSREGGVVIKIDFISP